MWVMMGIGNSKMGIDLFKNQGVRRHPHNYFRRGLEHEPVVTHQHQNFKLGEDERETCVRRDG
jgi:hypothetical protein